ncbi:uncharacterized protein BDZ99DRAFT_482247 [Mytilinidion resinicola]|uniref:Uncharacterized protein n=1 Tax=Mytilinidion resinicola TaxID=574789 RepID=A0A6A6Y4G9_9PEZI|nr:uncharacterized protein BDZ99DRAFT_482247 [Mytilinidion resinicola]KAF2803413.1 hypothetical protein BDZ99DRAFT_482247 [Mytilinidion resinicola]
MPSDPPSIPNQPHRTCYIRSYQISPSTFPDDTLTGLPRYPTRIRYAMRRAHNFILCASSTIDKLALDYLLNPPDLGETWNTAPKLPTPELYPTKITVYFSKSQVEKGSREVAALQRGLEREKVNWIIAGADVSELDGLLLQKADYLISGIQAEERIHMPIQNWFQHICEGTLQPVDEKIDISTRHLQIRQAGYSFRELSGQRRVKHRGDVNPNLRQCGRCLERHKRRDLCGVAAQELEDGKGDAKKHEGNVVWRWRKPGDGVTGKRWEKLTAQDFIDRFRWDKWDRSIPWEKRGEQRPGDVARGGWRSKVPVGEGKDWKTV